MADVCPEDLRMDAVAVELAIVFALCQCRIDIDDVHRQGRCPGWVSLVAADINGKLVFSATEPIAAAEVVAFETRGFDLALRKPVITAAFAAGKYIPAMPPVGKRTRGVDEGGAGSTGNTTVQFETGCRFVVEAESTAFRLGNQRSTDGFQA